ncbi:class I SAM-dependent methyltransferase [Streptomyces sp. NBC_00838]|uniref:class I SAM-dependent methyltransferase n=1 Tax=Streptomyces sp. NBC_00838 TaxID=2903680 RepID=UPI00386CEA0C|nr:class I SAM-dependent methyltransferase [Streptomyces sp. NBC_00838]
MFTPQGPTLRELTVQALSSTERGYDLLAPKFDLTPFRTPDPVLDAVADALGPLGPFRAGLDICCGTGAGVDVLREVCVERVTGVDFSAGMLATARSAVLPTDGAGAGGSRGPVVDFVRADARALPFRASFDLAVSFGAFGHFLPSERPGLFTRVREVLRPGGTFAFPVPAPPRVGSRLYWTLWGFDAAMRARNAVWRPPFVMYYRTFRLTEVVDELTRTGFEVDLVALDGLGRLPDGAPRCRMVVARRP